MNFNTLMADLAGMGVWNIILPFMLIFTIVYATLTTTLKGMFGKDGDNDRTKFAVIIAFVIALGVVIPHSIGAYPRNADVVVIINSALPQVALIAVAIVGLMILLGMFGINSSKWGGQGIQLFIVAAAIGIILYIFGTSAGWWTRAPRWLGFLNDPDTQALIIALLVFGLIVRLIVGKPEKKDKDGKIIEKNAMKTLNDISKGLFGGGGSE